MVMERELNEKCQNSIENVEVSDLVNEFKKLLEVLLFQLRLLIDLS